MIISLKNKKLNAKIISKQNGVVAGINFCKAAFKIIGKETIFKSKVRDGTKIKKNKVDFKKFPVVVMAGGEGKRMEPFYHVLPKPLIPPFNKKVIEHILNSF